MFGRAFRDERVQASLPIAVAYKSVKAKRALLLLACCASLLVALAVSAMATIRSRSCEFAEWCEMRNGEHDTIYSSAPASVRFEVEGWRFAAAGVHLTRCWRSRACGAEYRER